jgi:excisionase family DNA binding protein
MNVSRKTQDNGRDGETASQTVSVDEAARMIGISRALAYDAVGRGEIPTIRIGRRLLVPRAQLAAMLDRDNSRRSQKEVDEDE